MQARAGRVKMDQARAGRFSFQDRKVLLWFVSPEFIWMATGAGKHTHTVFKIRNNRKRMNSLA